MIENVDKLILEQDFTEFETMAAKMVEMDKQMKEYIEKAND